MVKRGGHGLSPKHLKRVSSEQTGCFSGMRAGSICGMVPLASCCEASGGPCWGVGCQAGSFVKEAVSGQPTVTVTLVFVVVSTVDSMADATVDLMADSQADSKVDSKSDSQADSTNAAILETLT